MDGVDADERDYYGRTPLSYAAENGYEAIARLLLGGGNTEPDSEDYFGRSPLLWPAESGHNKVARLPLTKECCATEGTTMTANRLWPGRQGNGHEAVVSALLGDPDVDVDCKNFDNRTPLSYAAENGHERIVRLLLATGKVDTLVEDDKSSRTPLK